MAKERLPEDIVTKKLENLEIPTLEDVKKLLGSDKGILESFYLSLALLYNVKRREGQKPYFLHPYSVAAKPAYRLKDHSLPSRFRLTPFEVCLGLIHDLGEEVGKNIVGSYVVGDVVKGFFGEELAKGLELLTNSNDLVYVSVEQSLKRLDVEKLVRLEANEVSERLKKKLNTLKIDEVVVREHYKRVKRALEGFVRDIIGYHEELSDEDKNAITELVSYSFINPLSTRLREGEILKPDQLAQAVRGDFEHVIGKVNNGPYVEADPKLVHPSESPYLMTLEKTLYQDFLDRIIKCAYERLKKASASDQLLDNPFSEVPIVKNCDSTATVTTLEADIVHAIHQFRKARRVILTDRNFIDRLNREGFDPGIYQKFQRSTDYLEENLKLSIRKHYELALKMLEQDTSYIRNVELLGYMLKKEDVKPPKQPLIRIGGFKLL